MLCDPAILRAWREAGAAAGAAGDGRDAAGDERDAAESPAVAGIGSLFHECDAEGGSDRSGEDDGSDKATEDDPALPPPGAGGVAFADPPPASSRGGEEEYFEQEDDDDADGACEEEYDAQYSGLHHEQASDDHDGEEGSEEEDRDAVMRTKPSRYAGHPLGVAQLEHQHRQVQEYKQQQFEEWAAAFRNENRWTVDTSRARAKVLVSEGYCAEKECLRLQREWLRSTGNGVKPEPTRRFGEAYQYPNPCFQTHGPEVLADEALHRKIVDDKSRTLVARWRNIGRQVADDMAEYDNFGNVIKNLSTMRIFLEGQQSMNYCIDMGERQRRIALYQSVIDLVNARDDGAFLKDALPRKGELAPDTPRAPHR